jgi:hypothetical protein
MGVAWGLGAGANIDAGCLQAGAGRARGLGAVG